MATLEEADDVLSSDALVVSDVIFAKDAAFQPMNRWYGSHHDDQPKLSGIYDEQPNQQAPMVALVNDTFPKGAGITIAILDSGINTTEHAALRNRISRHSRSFVSTNIDDININDVLGHGTQCAWLACGSKDIAVIGNHQYPVQGIAQEATVMVCKVVADETKCADIDAVIRALDYILKHNSTCAKNERVSVVSISWGMPRFHFHLSKKIQEVILHDIIVVCCASNNGGNGVQPITYPARLGHVLCIGSCNSGGRLSDFSASGREIDFLAPGENLWAPTNIGAPAEYSTVQGTSFSAALVAGLVCQILQDLNDLSNTYEQLHNVWGMREILKNMSTRKKHDEEKGFGILEPLTYFEKFTNEKKQLLSKIMCPCIF